MIYASIELSEVKRAEPSILESIKKEPNQKFPCRGVRGTHEMPEFSQCGKVESNMMMLCQPCLETYEAAANKSSESTPLVAGNDVEQVRQTEQKGSVVSRLATWVRNHKVLTAVAVLGGIGLVAGATATAAVLAKGADASFEFQKSNVSVSFGNVNYGDKKPSIEPTQASTPNSPPDVKPTQASSPKPQPNVKITQASAPKPQPNVEPTQASSPKPQPNIKTTQASAPKPAQPSAKKFPCSKFGNLQFYTPAKTNFVLKHNEQSLTQFFADENSRIDLDMTGLCQGDLIGSFTVICGGQQTELLPSDFSSQKNLNTRMSKTDCNPSVETSLIFSGNKTQTLGLDKDKMCDEGMIQDFKFKAYNSASLSATRDGELIALNADIFPNFDTPFIHEVKLPSNMCKDLFYDSMNIECQTLDDFSSAVFRLADLTKGKVNSLNLNDCSVTVDDADLPRKACTLDYDVMNECKRLA